MIQTYHAIMTVGCSRNYNNIKHAEYQVFAKNSLSLSSSQFTSSMLPGGPPAQWPHIEGKTSNVPIPGAIFATSYSESSGLESHKQLLLGERRVILREIQISLGRQHQGLGFYGTHGFFKLAIIRLLLRAISALPRLQHDKHIFGVFHESVSISQPRRKIFVNPPFDVAQASQNFTMKSSRSFAA